MGRVVLFAAAFLSISALVALTALAWWAPRLRRRRRQHALASRARPPHPPPLSLSRFNKVLKTLQFTPSSTYSCKFITSTYLACCGNDAVLRVLDLCTERQVRLVQASDAILALDVSGHQLVYGTVTGTLAFLDDVFDLARQPSVWAELGRAICAVALGRTHCVSGDESGALTVFDRCSGAQTHSLSAHSGCISRVAITADQDYVFSSSYSGQVLATSLSSFRHTLLGSHRDEVNSICLLPDGAVASVSDDETCRIWSVPQRVLDHSPHKPFCVAAHPRGWLATGASSGVIMLWDIDSGTRLALTTLPSCTRVNALSFSPAGGCLVAAQAGLCALDLCPAPALATLLLALVQPRSRSPLRSLPEDVFKLVYAFL